MFHNLGIPGLGAPDITPTRHGTPSAGAGGHEMFMGDGREAGLGLGNQDRGSSAEARQTTEWGVSSGTAGQEKESFMEEERGDYRRDTHMNDQSHVSATPLSGGG